MSIYSPVASHALSSNSILFYHVLAGDTVSDVLNQFGVCPLWGKDKSVARTLELNHFSNQDAARKLPAGSKIFLPVSALTISETEFHITADHEIQRMISDKREYCKKTPTVPIARTLPSPTPEPIIQEKLTQASVIVIQQPSPVPTPAPVVRREPSAFDLAISRLGFALDLGYFAVKSQDLSTGERSTMLSRLNPGALGYWKLEWNDQFETKATFRYQNYTIVQFEDYKSIQNPNGSRLSTELLGTYHFHNSFSLELGFGTEEELFNRSLNTSLIKIDTIALPYAKLGVNYRWLSYRGITLDQDVYGKYFFSGTTADYSIASGTEYGSSVTLSHRFDTLERKRIFLNLYYQSYSQNTSITNNQFTAIGMMLGLEFKLNDDN